MNEISALREAWGEVDPPAPGAQDRARTVLLARIAQAGDTTASPTRHRTRFRFRFRFRSAWAWRTGIATVAAAGLAVALLVTVDPAGRTGDPVNPPSTAAIDSVGETMELAAAYAAAQPYTPPRPDQWVYVEHRIASVTAGSTGLSESINKAWFRGDGREFAHNDGGRLVVEIIPRGPKLNPRDYATLAALPSDPQALLAVLGTGLEPVADDSAGRPGVDKVAADPAYDRNHALFELINFILRANVLPPDVTAALLRAAALIPGVERAAETVVVDGHPAIAIFRVGGWSREEILLDPDTHEFVGSRGVAAEDHALSGTSSAGRRRPDKSPMIRKGDVEWVITRIVGRVVDRPGQTR